MLHIIVCMQYMHFLLLALFSDVLISIFAKTWDKDVTQGFAQKYVVGLCRARNAVR